MATAAAPVAATASVRKQLWRQASPVATFIIEALPQRVLVPVCTETTKPAAAAEAAAAEDHLPLAIAQIQYHSLRVPKAHIESYFAAFRAFLAACEDMRIRVGLYLRFDGIPHIKSLFKCLEALSLKRAQKAFHAEAHEALTQHIAWTSAVQPNWILRKAIASTLKKTPPRNPYGISDTLAGAQAHFQEQLAKYGRLQVTGEE
jgi:hypothetical protein